MKVQRIFNPELLAEIMTEDDLWDSISEDGSISKEQYAENLDMEGMYVLALIGGHDDDPELHGFVIGRSITQTVVETHVAIRPEYWGHEANVHLGKLACLWLMTLPGVSKLVASIPVPDKEVLRYSQRVGFKREGVNKQSFLRNGELLDQYYVGMTNE